MTNQEPNRQRNKLTPEALERLRAAKARYEARLAGSASLPAVGLKRILSADLAPPHRTQLPEEYLSVESRALSTFDDNPLFGTYGAAKILAVSVELLKKWRQRDKGPDYVQYGPDGPVRYELEALTAFRAKYRVKVSAKL